MAVDGAGALRPEAGSDATHSLGQSSSAGSRLGASAEFGNADEEVARVLRVQHHYYAVLKVSKTTEAAQVRANYLRLSRLVHPDKCRHPQAADASAVVNQAYDTLRTAVKKALYDRYVDDVVEAQEDVSYAEWEAQNGVNTELPAWIQKVMKVPGGALCLFIILFPISLLLLLLLFLMVVVCLPFRLLAWCCCGYGRVRQVNEVPQPDENPHPYEPPPPVIPPVSPSYESTVNTTAGAPAGDAASAPTPVAVPLYEDRAQTASGESAGGPDRSAGVPPSAVQYGSPLPATLEGASAQVPPKSGPAGEGVGGPNGATMAEQPTSTCSGVSGSDSPSVAGQATSTVNLAVPDITSERRISISIPGIPKNNNVNDIDV